MRSPVLSIFLWSRAAIWLAALFAFLVFEPNRAPLADSFDTPYLHDSGWIADIWARWDSKWYLGIAQSGYDWDPGAPAFYPLYPFVVAVVSHATFGHYVLAGLLVSLVACYIGFVLLYRLGSEKLGAQGGRRAVIYLAFFPMALYLQAVYAESLCFALAAGAFLLGERGRWPEAWLCVGFAMLARPGGFALLPAIALLAWRASDRKRAFISMPVAPAIFALFPFVLWRQTGDAWSFLDAAGQWRRDFSPLGGLWDGVRQAIDGVGRLAEHAPTARSSVALGDDAWLLADAYNFAALLFLAVFIVLTVVAWRRFGAPYGVFCAVSLAVIVSAPASGGWPLVGLPRYGMVVFPFFLALAALGKRPAVHTAILVTSSLLLGIAIVQWALWQWVA